jgi:Family of unknown function (DUF6279)
MLTFRRFSTLFALAAILAFLGACSVATIAYNNASTVISYAVGDYVDLTPEQEKWLRPRVEGLIAWHRANELPLYQRTIEDLKARAAGTIKAEDLDRLYATGRSLVDRATDRVLPDMVEFLLLLNYEQISKLENKLAKDNEKLAKELRAGSDALKKKRVERYGERFEDWMGKLTLIQKAQIRDVVADMAPLEEYRLADRKRWQADFLKLLRERPESGLFQRELRQLILAPEVKRDPAYQAEWGRQQKAIIDLGAAMMSGATERQRQRVQKRLAGYANDIAALLNHG